MPINMQRAYDPLYGVVDLTDLEYTILKSPEIQRLRYVRMCNINSMLVTGASEISRFEHTIGVLRLAKEWTNANSLRLTHEELEDICIAAILHDFQTGPFGHSLQYVLEDNETDGVFVHDDIHHGTYQKYHQIMDLGASFAGRPFASEKILLDRWNKIAKLVRGEGQYGPLISGSVDLDNIDNVIRLAYHVGVASRSDAEIGLKLAKDLDVKKGGLELSEISLIYVERWQEIRKRLYELLLLDWAEFSAKGMLTRAMELAIEFKLVGTDSWLRTDLELLDYLEKESVGEAQEVGEIVKRIRCGDLYYPLYLGRSLFINMYERLSNADVKKEMQNNLEEVIRSDLKLKTNILIHPILDSKKTSRSVEVTIRESGKKHIVGKDSKQLLIGIFLSKKVESITKTHKLNGLVNNYLVDLGFTDICEINDPMNTIPDIQMDLL